MEQAHISGSLTGTPARITTLVPSLTVWQLTGMCYFAVAGGPFGIEDVLRTGGATATTAGLLLLPFIWSIPIALKTAELSTLFPTTGGHVNWVEEGLGPSAGFINSVLAILTSLTDNAMYPLMFTDYLARLLNMRRLPGTAAWATRAALAVATAAANIRGVEVVGTSSILFGALVATPFLVLTVLAGTSSPEAPTLPQGKDRNPGTFLTLLMWNLSGFDSAGTCAGEVKDAGKAYPVALSLSMVLVVVTYLLPLLAAQRVMPDESLWVDGAWVTAARVVGGQPLAAWVGAMGLVSSAGLLLTFLCTTSRLLYGVAERGYLPRWLLTQHARFHTPQRVIILNALASLTLTAVDFGQLAQVTTVFYSVSAIARFVALWRLRYSRPPHLPGNARPFAVPGGHIGMAFTCVPPVLLSIVAISLCEPLALGMSTAAIATVSIARGVWCYFQFARCANNRLVGASATSHAAVKHLFAASAESSLCFSSNDPASPQPT